ncbi:hypothetical protein [Beijerinckia indica]|uniref:hypothetical protein n=1 Tax=Beijerinckia indica TaxID=533 RepID=UPI00059F4D90|nr:hypothetical protein [Beijerinckia indica]
MIAGILSLAGARQGVERGKIRHREEKPKFGSLPLVNEDLASIFDENNLARDRIPPVTPQSIKVDEIKSVPSRSIPFRNILPEISCAHAHDWPSTVLRVHQRPFELILR